MTKKATSKKTTSKPTESPRVSVRILKHKTKVGGVICASGAVVKLPQEKADALVANELGEIIGI